MPVDQLGRMLLIGGLMLAGIGLVLVLAGRVPFLGRLPGDFTLTLGNVTISVPLASSILLSVVLTVVLNLVLRR